MKHDNPPAVIYVTLAPILSMRSTRLLDALALVPPYGIIGLGHHSDNDLSPFLAATKQLYEHFRPSAHLSVTPFSVCSSLSLIVSSWNFQELLTLTKVMQTVKVRDQRSRSQRSKQILPQFHFRTVNSSLDLQMAMKWCTNLDVA